MLTNRLTASRPAKPWPRSVDGLDHALPHAGAKLGPFVRKRGSRGSFGKKQQRMTTGNMAPRLF